MKYFIFVFLFVISFFMHAQKPIRIGVITDLHYLSDSLIKDGSALDKYVQTNGRTIQYSSAILDKVFDDYRISNIDVLLITGDLTKDGELKSHVDLKTKLQFLREKGVQIFVIPGNHDINMPYPIGFESDKTYKVKDTSPSEFTDIYSDYGYSSAIMRDSASLSYLSILDDKTWLLAIDAARYNEYTTSSITAGRILPSTEKWIIDILAKANKKGIRVLGMMHWGLVEHLPYQSTFFSKYLVDDWQRLASLFADNGLEIIFTGHFHTNDISSYTTNSGNTIYDIETGTLSSYPYAYRLIDYYPDRLDIETRNVLSISENPNLANESKEQVRTLSERLALSMLSSKGLDINNQSTQFLAKTMAEIFIIHAWGDEVLSDDLRNSLNSLSMQMEIPIDADNIEIDFPPADNNLIIEFKK